MFAFCLQFVVNTAAVNRPVRNLSPVLHTSKRTNKRAANEPVMAHLLRMSEVSNAGGSRESAAFIASIRSTMHSTTNSNETLFRLLSITQPTRKAPPCSPTLSFSQLLPFSQQGPECTQWVKARQRFVAFKVDFCTFIRFSNLAALPPFRVFPEDENEQRGHPT